MYSGILKGMASKAGGGKDQKLQHKRSGRSFSSSDSNSASEEIINLKNTLFVFRNSLQNFSSLVRDISPYGHPDVIHRLHAAMGEILNAIRSIVDKYPSIATPDVFSAVHMLVSYVQDLREFPASSMEADRLINQLALYFTKSVSRYLIQLREVSETRSKSSDKTQGKESKNSNTIFGIELEKHLQASKLNVPFVVTKCIKEIETHGLYVNGIYRVSAVKSKVNQLCEAFEKYGNKVSLNDVNPNIVANVLKLYLRELPQPLFTFELYPEFIRVAKLYGTDSSEENKKRCIDELREVLAKLPKCYYTVVAEVMRHLHRISTESAMNNMSSYNLAVIFGPTLLHCLRNTSESGSKAALFDSVHQIRAIELMITLAEKLFHSDPSS